MGFWVRRQRTARSHAPMSASYVRWEGEADLSPTRERGLALAAPFSLAQALPVNALCTGLIDEATADDHLRMHWRVENRAEALVLVHALLEVPSDGAYRVAGEVYERAQAAGRRGANAIYAQLPARAMDAGVEPGLAAQMYHGMALADANSGLDVFGPGRPSTLAGWDLARAAQLTRLLVDVDQLTRERAWGLLVESVAAARHRLSSWEGFANSFLTGESIWSGGTASPRLREAVTTLLEDRAGPWGRWSW